MRARLTLAVLLALETTAVVLVVRRPGPVPVDWGDPWGWLGRTDPTTATLVVGRGLVLLVAGWLLLVTVGALVARLAAVTPGTPRRIRRLVGALGRCAPGVVRHLVEAAVTVGVVAATISPAAAAPPAHRTPRAPVVVRPLVPPLGPVRDGRADASPSSQPSSPPPALPVGVPEPAAGPTGDPGVHHRVVEGEHLWAIAEAVVRARGGTDDPAAVDRYWRVLCDANRDRLASGDPNVVTPGEDLDLPPVA